MSDNELDNLFKEAAEGFKDPHDPGAWKNMSSKLDQTATGSTFWNWKTISSFTVTGVAIVAGILYFSTRDTQDPDQSIPSSHLAENKLPPVGSSDHADNAI